MGEPIFISDLIQKILKGNIRIPSFQRGFVWDADRVAHLMDSIYKGYPFGTLLFWRTKTPLSTERMLGPYNLPDNEPDYPIDYILDGQQRATSIFGVFQSLLDAKEGFDDSIFKIYYDLTSKPDVKDSQFLCTSDEDYDPKIFFPLRILFNPPEYRKFLRNMDDSIADQVDELYKRFTTAKIPVQTFENDDRAAVAIVFERINRLGVELDTLQLLSAWSWSDDFDLQEQFQDLAEDLQPFGFKEIGEDSDLLLRCCGAILKGDASPNTIINLNGRLVRERFIEIKNGVLGAIDYLRANLNIYSTSILPYSNIIVPLSVFFATNDEQGVRPSSDQHKIIVQWVWKTFFSRRYSKRLEQLNQDIKETAKLKSGYESRLGQFQVTVNSEFFMDNNFNMRNVNSKTFILMLANEGPLNFIDGSKIILQPVLRDCNKKEFHHLYPKTFLEAQGISQYRINSLTNICLLSRLVNNNLGGDKPSIYKAKMPNDETLLREIMRKSLCPEDIFHDDFDRFIAQRNEVLVKKANQLMGI